MHRKSLKDIVSMHQEAEKLIGRQGSEVGELRRVVDDFIKTQTAKESKKPALVQKPVRSAVADMDDDIPF